MKILVVCHQGNNRSVTIAHQLKYMGHDVLSVGTETNSKDTLRMLTAWADKIIMTEPGQKVPINSDEVAKVELWNIGEDKYPRPFNKQLLAIVKRLIAENRDKL